MITSNEIHTPSKLLEVAHELYESGNPNHLRPAILEAITCLESYVQEVVFKSLANKLDPLLVEWLEEKTKMDFDTRISILTPIATGYSIDKQSDLWNKYKKARLIRNRVVHSGKSVNKQEAQFVLDTVHEWLAYLASSIEVELALRDLKKQVESQKISVKNKSEATNLVIEYFGAKYSAKSSFSNSQGFNRISEPDIVLEFGKYKIAVNAKFGRQRIVDFLYKEKETEGRKEMGQYYLPKVFTHGAVVFFVSGKQNERLPDIVWSNENIVSVFIKC